MTSDSSSEAVRARVPTARDIAAVFFRQRRIILVVFSIVVVALVSYGLCCPGYRAEMKLIVRKGRVDPPVAPQPTAPSEYSHNEVTEEEINSEVQLLQDPDVLRPVVVSIGLQNAERASWVRTSDRGEARITRAVRRLASRLVVSPVRKTQLISVAYECGDPEMAARVLRQLSVVYLQKHLVAHRPAGESSFFQQQAFAYGKALDDSERRLLNMIQSGGVVSPAMQRDLTLQKLSDADSAYRQISLQRRETEERIRGLKYHLASLPERRTTEIHTADNPELLQQLKSTLLNLELKRVELLTKYQPEYRLVQEVEQQITDTRTAIRAESLAPVHQEITDNEPRYDWAATELEKAEVEADALRARETAAAVLVVSYRQAAERLAEQAIAEQDLLRSAKVAEENYLLYLRKREEAHIGDALDEHGIVNVAVVQDPIVPALPRWSMTSVMIFAVIAGAVLGTGVGFTMDYLDPRFRTPDEVADSLGLPTLACWPREAA